MAVPLQNNNDDGLLSFFKDMGIEGSRLFNTVINNRQAYQLAQQLMDNKALYDALKDCFDKMCIDPSNCSFTKQSTQDLVQNKHLCNFLNRFKDQDWGVVDDDICGKLKGMQSKHSELEGKCNPKAFQKSLNWFYIAYFAMSVANLCFSWKQIYDTSSELESASQKLQRITTRLKKIKNEDVEAIIQYNEKINRLRVIDNIFEYRNYETKINAALQTLISIKHECETEIELLQKNGKVNAMGAITMAHSSWTSASLISLIPGWGTPFAILSGVQAVTAVAHGVQAFQSFDKCDKFKKLAKEIEDVIVDLKTIKYSLQQYENAYMQQVSMWDVQQTVTWTRGVGYDDVATLFEGNNINGDDLVNMDHVTLQELGVSSHLKRKRLLRKIKKVMAKN